MKDQKTGIIVFLAVIIVLLLLFIGFQTIRSRVLASQQNMYLKGMRDGQLLQQRDIVNNIITYGYHIIPVLDENNQTRNVALGVLQQQPAIQQPPAMQEAAAAQVPK